MGSLHEHGVRRGRPVEALLQVNVSGEDAKAGYAPHDVRAEAESGFSVVTLVLALWAAASTALCAWLYTRTP